MKLITCHGGRLLTLGEMPGDGLPCVSVSPDVPSFRTGLSALDAIAPGGAFRRGTVHEILSDPAGGTPLFFATLLARSSCGAGEAAVPPYESHGRAARGANGGALVWCDPGHGIYPPALAAQGIDLERLFLLQPKTPAEQTWAVGECLKCRGVAAVVAEVSAAHRLTRVAARRLQLSAERGGGVGLLLRPGGKASAEHAAATRWLVRPAPGERTVQRWSVQLLHGHGGRIGHTVILEHSRETNRVRAVEKLADRRRGTPLWTGTA
jgi:protein ImuA